MYMVKREQRERESNRKETPFTALSSSEGPSSAQPPLQAFAQSDSVQLLQPLTVYWPALF